MKPLILWPETILRHDPLHSTGPCVWVVTSLGLLSQQTRVLSYFLSKSIFVGIIKTMTLGPNQMFTNDIKYQHDSNMISKSYQVLSFQIIPKLSPHVSSHVCFPQPAAVFSVPGAIPKADRPGGAAPLPGCPRHQATGSAVGLPRGEAARHGNGLKLQ